MSSRALALVCCAAVAASTARGEDICAGLASPGVTSASGAAPFRDTTILSLTAVAADAARGVPAFCEVRAAITPAAGSHIGAVYRLPESWNGKLLGVGGGGFAGDVTLQAATAGLARGYAVVQNDLGHPSADALDPSFALDASGARNVEGIVDFGHRATHLATVVGKDVAAKLYGRAPRYAYFQGCSTGGRQGLAEVQRYPDDYDGVIAGAPVYTPLVYSNAILRVQAFHSKPESNLLPAQVLLIQKAVLAACDTLDGVADGILTDPRACSWDPGELECKAAASAECLTHAQVETVRRVYAGVKTKDGKYAAMPIMRGGESDWVARMVGTPEAPNGVNARLGAPFMSYIVKADARYDLFTFDPERDMAALAGGIAGAEVHQQNPAIGPFVARGGKLLLWHGFNDPGPSPVSTIEYFEAVQRAVPAARESVRLFLAPGVLHCRGGAGPDRFDALTALESWVERGTAPATLLATKAGSTLSRPLCPYPQLPRYKGTGDPGDAANFECGS